MADQRNDRHESITYADLLQRNLPRPKPLVAGILDEGCGGIIAGPPNVGKTWVVLSLARAVASGTPWLDRFETTQSAVVIFDEEGHLPGMQDRCRMFEAASPLDPAPEIYFCVGHGVRLDTQAGVERLEAVISEHRPGLVIIDSLTRVHGGDENDAGSMAGVFAVAKQLMRAYGTAVLFTDHLRKKSLINDPEEMLRGSTEKRAWPDSILFASPGENTRMTITHAKSRWGPRLEPFVIELDANREAGTVAVSFAGPVVADAITKGNDIVEAIQAIHTQLGSKGVDATAIAAWLDCSADTVRRHLRKLVQAGLVTNRTIKAGERGGRPKEVYAIPSEPE